MSVKKTKSKPSRKLYWSNLAAKQALRKRRRPSFVVARNASVKSLYERNDEEVYNMISSTKRMLSKL